MLFTSLNPATGEVLEEIAAHARPQIASMLQRSRRMFAEWRDLGYDTRADLLRNAAAVLRGNIDTHARAITLEMGKPIRQSRAEVEKCAWVCDYYADNAETILQHERLPSDATRSYVRFDPVGPVLAVMPWNFPYWQVFRFAAPALMAGNTGLLKHASNVPRCALLIEDVFRQAGVPEGVFQTLLLPSADVAGVIADPAVAAVTLTGSEAAGSAVATAAGAAIKKSVLELGGSDAFIVLDDADVERAAATAATSRMLNTGQSCIAAKRFIVTRSVAEKFTSLFADAIQAMRLGDPLDENTDIGAMAREDLLTELDQQVRRSLREGAQCLFGGKRREGNGAFYEATLLTEVTPSMPAFREELFGPVAPVIVVDDEQQALAAANDSLYGLGASVWTEDRERAEHLAAGIEAGAVFINGLVKSDPRLPFGGVKLSGYGRELSHYGLKEFVNIKTVWVQ